MNIGLIIVIIIGIIFLGSAIIGIKGQKKWSREYEQSIKLAGFILRPELKETVKQAATQVLLQKHNIINNVDEPYHYSYNSGDVYYAGIDLGGKGKYGLVIADAFIFPLKPQNDQPFVIFIKSETYKGEIYTKDLITKKYIMSDLYKPHDLGILPTDEQTAGGSILFAYGPSGSSLNDILSPSQLAMVKEIADIGFFALYYNQGKAGLFTVSRFKNHAMYKMAWKDQWECVKSLMDAG